MAKSLSLIYFLPKSMASSTKATIFLSLLPSKKPNLLNKPIFSLSQNLFSTTSTRYPLQYEMIIHRPAQPQRSQTRPRPARVTKADSDSDLPQKPDSEDGIGSWVDQKLSAEEMDKSKRKYYRKRRKRMYGSDSDEENRKNEDGFVELKPEVVEFYRLHKREEELYFYDTFAYPWEKDRHYKMVYQLEKKYFPDQCLDKAFLDPKELNKGKTGTKRGEKGRENAGVGQGEEDKRLVFFDEDDKGERGANVDENKDVTERKVEEFFKCLKKVPNKDNEVGTGEPYLATRRTGLPPRWDGPYGTVLLINKPKGK